MSVAEIEMPVTMRRMAKRKTDKPKTSGQHTKKRIGVNFTEDWHAVLRRLAGQRKQPVLWYLIDLAKEEAQKAGIPTPPVPWESGEESLD